MRLRLAPVAALTVLALVPAAASGSVAYMSEDGFPVGQGSPGEDNVMTLRSDGDSVIITDTVGIAPKPDGFGCEVVDPNTVRCLGGDGGQLLGEDGNDSLTDVGAARGFGARGGPGDDTITAGTVDALLYGDDRTVQPTDGNDTITGSTADNIDPNQRGDFDDMINGGGGNDTIDGREGTDMVSGQAGNDTVDGGAGNDEIDNTSLVTSEGEDAEGSEGNDVLRGGAGDDQVDAYLGKDTVDLGSGNDQARSVELFLRDDDIATDTFICGDGTDRVAVGIKDRISLSCETLQVSMKCLGGYPCKVSGRVTGKPKGAKKATTIAKASSTFTAPRNLDFTLGKKAAKLLGSAKKLALLVNTSARQGGRPTSDGRTFPITLTP